MKIGDRIDGNEIVGLGVKLHFEDGTEKRV